MRLIAIEGGGTTWVAAVAEVDSTHSLTIKILEDTRRTFLTEDPLSTLSKIREWIRNQLDSFSYECGDLGDQSIKAIGVGCFGPINAKPATSINNAYGFITTTPKPGWRNTDVLSLLGLHDEFKHLPHMFDTDVNAPALAEYQLLRSSGLTSCAYVTVGTGVGVGLVVNGATVKGMMHPEAGHMQVKAMTEDCFRGTCPFHGACIEGMCSSGALAERASVSPAELAALPDDHPIWDTCAYYLAQLCANLILTVSPERISIGGGVLNRRSLYPKIRIQVQKILNGYIQVDDIMNCERLDDFIGPSFWGTDAGIVGAAYLGKLAFDSRS